MGLFILFTPFLVGFALCISDGDADLPQHLLVDLADRCSQRPDGGRGVEIKDCHEIFVVEVAFRLQSAAGHQSVSDADGGCCFELYSDVKLIIFLQKGTVNDIEEVLLMLRPVFLSQFSGYLGELSGKVITGNIIGALKHGLHRIQMALLQLPQPGSAGIFTGSGVGNIKNIAQAGPVPGIVHQSDSLGAAPYIPAHLFIPQIVLCTGGSVRTLGVDHQLLMERVLVKAGSSGEKPCPFLPAPRELRCHLLRHLCI
ncbi:MAG: hypothetical protein ACLRY6_11355 [[Clostridium] innocuum]|uniref:Uncharacterized protein n=1 Tax=Clostridium innocuum TaxID=1522 RepID=A0AAP2USE7_CLOIN|nr:hypothetical protein [[Clostridium] innocuum]MCR0380339.1 hypothetical protein [[Clostridium] innocuum]MCR0654473.1 hypothetical protein [[Clostridium] innocuum]